MKFLNLLLLSSLFASTISNLNATNWFKEEKTEEIKKDIDDAANKAKEELDKASTLIDKAGTTIQSASDLKDKAVNAVNDAKRVVTTTEATTTEATTAAK